MRSTFFGLNIGYKGLQAQQRALDVTSHNVANANTQGYTRQDVILETSPPIKVLEGYVGTGVDVAEFRRMRDQFIDIQIRTENKALGEWEVKSNILGKLEVIINEPSDSSLRNVLDDYWESWQKLSKNPESVAVRATVMQSGLTLAESFNHLDRQFTDLQEDINRGISIKVDEINSLARQLRDLNVQVVKAESSGNKANDLRDKRDLLLEQLAKVVDVGVVEDQLGAVNVTIGGRSLVARGYINEIKFTYNENNPLEAKMEWFNSLTQEVQGDVGIASGELKGYLHMRDVVVTNIQGKISDMAKSVAEQVNNLHHQGYGLDDNPGIDFFVKSDAGKPFMAGNIEVNQLLVDDVNLLAAGKTQPVLAGDGENALDIAQLSDKLVMNGGKATLGDFYRSTVAQLGVDALEAERMMVNQSLLTDQLINKRAEVSGVSLDEEMTNMIKFQHAYSASARVINIMDEMLDLIVNRLGLVGR